MAAIKPSCIVIRLAPTAENPETEGQLGHILAFLDGDPGRSVQWFAPAAVLAESVYGPVADRIREGKDSVLLAGWSGSDVRFAPDRLARLERNWTWNSPFGNGADNLFGAGAWASFGSEGWRFSGTAEHPVLSGLDGDVALVFPAELRGNPSPWTLRKAVKNAAGRATRTCLLFDLRNPDLLEWLVAATRISGGKAAAALPPTDPPDHSPEIAQYAECPFLPAPWDVTGTTPRNRRDSARLLKSHSGWFPKTSTPDSRNRREPELYSDMPGACVLEDGFGVSFEAGVPHGLRINRTPAGPRKPTRSAIETPITTLAWETVGGASFDGERTRGLRQLMSLEGEKASTEYLMEDDEPGIRITFRWDPPQVSRILEKFGEIKSFTPWEFPLFDLNDPASVENAADRPWVIPDTPCIYRIPGTEFLFRQGSKAVGIRFSLPRHLPGRGLSFRVTKEKKRSILWINPFGFYSPVSPKDLAAFPDAPSFLLLAGKGDSWKAIGDGS